jgi:hypothetical protein
MAAGPPAAVGAFFGNVSTYAGMLITAQHNLRRREPQGGHRDQWPPHGPIYTRYDCDREQP